MHQHRYPRTVHRLAVGALCALVLAGCTSGDKGSTGAAGSTSRAATESPAAGAPAAGDTAAATAPPTGYSGDPVVVRGAQAGQLVSVTGKTVDGVDQLTFQFDGAAPGYRVEAVRRITTGPDGDVVEVKGKSFLQVSFASTTPNANGAIAEGIPTNTDLGLPVLKQIVLAYNVAGDVRFGVGVDAAAPTFRVVPLADPTRLVLEVRAG